MPRKGEPGWEAPGGIARLKDPVEDGWELTAKGLLMAKNMRIIAQEAIERTGIQPANIQYFNTGPDEPEDIVA